MSIWRLARAHFAALDGEGARRYGARWTSPGLPAVYAASHLSLAALEYLAHIDIEDVPGDLVALEIGVPEDADRLVLDTNALPARWFETPPPSGCRAIGDAWLSSGQALIFQVPSVLVPEEMNVLVNPGHPRAGEVRVLGSRPFGYDPRLLQGDSL